MMTYGPLAATVAIGGRTAAIDVQAILYDVPAYGWLCGASSRVLLTNSHIFVERQG
jgi:hypothetical protein